MGGLQGAKWGRGGHSLVGWRLQEGTNSASGAGGTIYISDASPNPRGDDFYASWSTLEKMDTEINPLNTECHRRPSSYVDAMIPNNTSRNLVICRHIGLDRAVTKWCLVIRDFVVSQRSKDSRGSQRLNLFRSIRGTCNYTPRSIRDGRLSLS